MINEVTRLQRLKADLLVKIQTAKAVDLPALRIQESALDNQMTLITAGSKAQEWAIIRRTE
jgi:hypothetical protein